MSKYSLGIDIGGTFIKYALVDEDYNIKERWADKTTRWADKTERWAVKTTGWTDKTTE